MERAVATDLGAVGCGAWGGNSYRWKRNWTCICRAVPQTSSARLAVLRLQLSNIAILIVIFVFAFFCSSLLELAYLLKLT